MPDYDCPLCGGIVRGRPPSIRETAERLGIPVTERKFIPEAGVPPFEDDIKSPWDDLEDENADLKMALVAASSELAILRHAIEDFIIWWDMPPYVLDDDEKLRVEVDALRSALLRE